MLLRHAKSDRPPGISDFDRPLNGRGRKAAPRMGAYLAAENLRPDHVVLSPSLRTRETWEPVRAALGGPDATPVEAIYEAPTEALLAVVRSTPEAAASLLMIGHNPGLQDLAAMLVGTGPRDLRSRLDLEFPTAALAIVDFDLDDWREIAPGTGRIERFVVPRDLGNGRDLGDDPGA
jgi:phosphohistidine phosphatase